MYERNSCSLLGAYKGVFMKNKMEKKGVLGELS